MVCAGSEMPATEGFRSGETAATCAGDESVVQETLPELNLFFVPLSFRLFDCSQPIYTPAVWHNINPLLDHRVHFASLHTSQRLLDYLQSSAVVLELWGLQGEDAERRALTPVLIRRQRATAFRFRGLYGERGDDSRGNRHH